ncbi:MAG: hypothetical protein PHW91_02435, partial [Bacteroidales bacterium]|nr:hypothetical protein [Bacteroidales bacterium]
SMQVSSHNPLFNDPINNMRARERRIKVKAGQIPFNFVVGTRRELQRARERYYEITGKIPDESEVNQGNLENQETENSTSNENNNTEEQSDTKDNITTEKNKENTEVPIP